MVIVECVIFYRKWVLSIFRQLLLNQGHHRNIHCNTVLFHIHVHWSISNNCNTNPRQIKQASSSFCLATIFWFILSYVSNFYIFSFITHSKCVKNMNIFQFFNFYVFLLWLFKKELSTSKVYYSDYCYRTFLLDLQWD